MNAKRSLLTLIAAIAFGWFAACNYTEGECWYYGEGSENAGAGVGQGGGVIVPNGPSGVGSYGDAPPKQPQDATDPKQKIKCNSDEDEDTEAETESPADGSTGGDNSQDALVKQWLEDPQPEGGVICSGPVDCVKKCVAESKFCMAEFAMHPYKAGEMGELYDCIDSFPKAKYGGSYTCLYRFPNGDACIFSHGSKLGPLKLPAPPPLCVYKGGK
jgi:hypothetical protein